MQSVFGKLGLNKVVAGRAWVSRIHVRSLFGMQRSVMDADNLPHTSRQEGNTSAPIMVQIAEGLVFLSFVSLGFSWKTMTGDAAIWVRGGDCLYHPHISHNVDFFFS